MECKLTLVNEEPSWAPYSTKKFLYKCSCGRQVSLAPRTISYGNTSSCGKCNWKPKEFWLQQQWGHLRLVPGQPLPEEFPPSGRQPYLFQCDCGKTATLLMGKVVTGHTSSCGRCNHIERREWLHHKWGSLSLRDVALPESWPPSSMRSMEFRCDCGRDVTLPFRKVRNGNNTSCGHCGVFPREHWLQQRWGKLRLDPAQPLELSFSPSDLRLKFICDCGRITTRLLRKVTDSSSCEKCDYKPRSYWLTQRWGMLRIDPEQSLPEAWGAGLGEVTVICDCGNKHTTRFSNLEYGYTHSCGCAKVGENKFSVEAEIRDFMKSLAPDTWDTSYTIPGTRKQFDVWVPSHNLAVEHHGLVWNSSRYRRSGRILGDYEKFRLACDMGVHLIQVYQDEWREKPGILKAMLRNLIAGKGGKRVKPVFSVERTTSSEVRMFLDKHHYLGAASGCVTIVARYKEDILGAWVFMKRETGVVLWHRACVNHEYKMWNPHEKALALAKPHLKELGFKEILTFSDNRFHTGDLYEKLGFRFEEEIPPDYYYTNGTTRKSKFAFRVPAGVNEEEEAARKGWFRIYDSGKKRYRVSL